MATDKPVLAYNRAEAAKAVGLSERTLAKAIASGDLPAHQPTGGRILILADDLLAWIKGSAA